MQRFRIGAITDEFSPNISTAADAMTELGMQCAELRVIGGKNIMDLTPDELQSAMDVLRAHKLEVVSIATPILKCTLPDAPEIDSRFQQDIFNSKHSFEDQPALAEH